MIQAAPKGEGGGVHTLDQIPALGNSTHTVANTHPTINSMAAQSCKYCSIHQAPPPLPSSGSLLQTLRPSSLLRATGSCLERHGSKSKGSRRTKPAKRQMPRRQALPQLKSLCPRGVTNVLFMMQAEGRDDEPERPLTTEI